MGKNPWRLPQQFFFGMCLLIRGHLAGEALCGEVKRYPNRVTFLGFPSSSFWRSKAQSGMGSLHPMCRTSLLGFCPGSFNMEKKRCIELQPSKSIRCEKNKEKREEWRGRRKEKGGCHCEKKRAEEWKGKRRNIKGFQKECIY